MADIYALSSDYKRRLDAMMRWWQRASGSGSKSSPRGPGMEMLGEYDRHFVTTADFETGGTVAVDWYDLDTSEKAYTDSGDDGEVIDCFSWWDDVSSGTKGVARLVGLDDDGNEIWDIIDLDICQS